MSTSPAPTLLRIAHHKVQRFDEPVLLRAEAGTLWITIDGHAEDIVLEAGESRVFDGRARVLVTPLGDAATLSVLRTAALPARPARRPRWLWRAALALARAA